MNIGGISWPDVNNGTGCRVTLWISGCSHHCLGCQNSETWNPNYGRKFGEEDKNKLFELLEKPYIKGITYSGGDPLYCVDEVYDLMKEINEKFPTKDTWLYTGYTLKEIQESEKLKKVLEYTDYLVDGRFILSERDITLPFRGSKNQNIWHKTENGEFEIVMK